MIPQWIIEKKRDGHPLTQKEINFFINGYTNETIPQYQMAALAMAIYLKGMTYQETAHLTHAMMHSGDLINTDTLTLPKADKHSTGGIGDKVSLILAPLAACCGLAVPMLSGRGLGITGGTLDKLEAIPGYRTDLTETQFLHVIQTCGCSITGQTGDVAPADKKLYALRDVTATVPSIPLITASIMCKKLAEGIDALVLDVKCGQGAFMKNIDDARQLAHNMVRVGQEMGKDIRAIITNMDQPLGRCIGNALEVKESILCLQNKGPADLMEITLTLTAHMLTMTGKAPTLKDAHTQLQTHLQSGAAITRFKQMVQLQNGDPDTIDHPQKLPQATIIHPLPAPTTGYIQSVNAQHIGRGVLLLGAGRQKTNETIDPAVGLSDLRQTGEHIQQGQPLMLIHANTQNQLNHALKELTQAITLNKTPPTPTPLILETI